MQQIVNTTAEGQHLNADGKEEYTFNNYLNAVGLDEDLFDSADGDDDVIADDFSSFDDADDFKLTDDVEGFYNADDFGDDGLLNASGKEKRKKKREERKAKRKKMSKKEKRRAFWHTFGAIATGGASLLASKKGREQLKKVGKAVVWVVKQSVFRVPLMSFVGLLRINFLGMANRMWAGAISKEEAEKKGLDMKNWERAQKAVKKVEKALRKMGFGDKDIKDLFYPAIIKGHDKPPFRSRKKAKADKDKAKEMADKAKAKKEGKIASFDGENDYFQVEGDDDAWYSVEGLWEAAAIAAGSAVLGIVADVIKKAGVNKNPYADGKAHDGVPDEDMLKDWKGASAEQQAEATKQLINNNPDLTPEQKQEMLAEVDESIKDLDDAKNNPNDFFGDADTQTYLIYGGVGLVITSLLFGLYKVFSGKK